jgi:hypothetical protein
MEGGANPRDGFGAFKTAVNCAAHMGNTEMVDYLLPRMREFSKNTEL